MDSFWSSPLGAYLSTPASLIPTLIAVGALVVSGLSFRHTVKRAPRPDLRVLVLQRDEPHSRRVGGKMVEAHDVKIRVRNWGDGTALDVRVEAVRADGTSRQFAVGSLPLDKTHELATHAGGELPELSKIIVRWKWAGRTHRLTEHAGR